MSIKILLQTTIPSLADDWHIGRFSLLRSHLARMPSFEVAARDRGPLGQPDPVLSSLHESDYDELWLFAVDGGDGLTAADHEGIARFRQRGSGVLITRDHMEDGIGYAPGGKFVRQDGGAIDAAQRCELEAALTAGQCANNAVLEERDGRWSVRGDPTEGALLVAARKAGLHEQEQRARYHRVGEVPFSSERKLMSAVHADALAGSIVLFAKGAPEVLLPRCTSETAGANVRPLHDRRRA